MEALKRLKDRLSSSITGNVKVHNAYQAPHSGSDVENKKGGKKRSRRVKKSKKSKKSKSRSSRRRH